MLVGIGLIELTKPSDTLLFEPFCKHCILQRFYTIFIVSICVEQKFLFKKLRQILHFLIWFWVILSVSILKVLFLVLENYML